jgi:hypothetical protein
MSMPIHSRLRRCAAAIAVLHPQKGSKMVSPSLLLALIIRSNKQYLRQKWWGKVSRAGRCRVELRCQRRQLNPTTEPTHARYFNVHTMSLSVPPGHDRRAAEPDHRGLVSHERSGHHGGDSALGWPRRQLSHRPALLLYGHCLLRKAGVRDLLMEVCCALHNFRVRLTPWQPMV